MVRSGIAIVILCVTAGPALAQDAARDAARDDAVGAMVRRTGRDRAASDLVDRLDDVDAFLAAHLVGRLASRLAPQGVVGDHILERLSDDRYTKALADYCHLLKEEEPLLVEPTAREAAGCVGLSNRDSREIAFDRIARLPPSILDQYRERIDADAARLLAEGRSSRDPAPLQLLVRDFRASRQASEALALLGDLAFERGEFEQALTWWRTLAPLPSRELVNYRAGGRKTSPFDLPRLHAKQTLALIFARRPEAGREIDAVKTLHPDARGQLAGRTDAYHAILAHWRNTLGDDIARDREMIEPWPTFAGEPDRNRTLLAAPSERLWLDGSTWKKPLPALMLKPTPPVWMSATRSLAIPPTPFHPVIAVGQVLVSDGQSVHSFDLLTGAARFRSPAPVLGARPNAPSTWFSLAAANGRVYACLGERPGDALAKSLVCLDLAKKGDVVWKAAASAVDDRGEETVTATFDTDPLVRDDRVFAGVQRAGNKSTRFLASYKLDGTLDWQTKLADIAESNDPAAGRRPLLVSSGPMVLYASNAGIVVAVDRWTGRRLWAFRYPTIDTGVSPRGPSSCLASDGRVFVAPADSDRLFCLDASTGRELWDQLWIQPPTDVVPGPRTASQIVDLLGVSDDRLVFTDRYRLQAVDVSTGSVAWQQPATGRLPSHGRGLLAGPWVFWPTADPDVSWRAVAHATGGLRDVLAVPEFYDPTTLRGLPPGNIVFGEGCLVVAGPGELTVFVPAGRQLPALEQIPQAQRDSAALYRLALAQLAHDEKTAAARTLTALDASVPDRDRAAWRSLAAARTTAVTSARPPVILRRATAPIAEPNVERVRKLVPLWGPRPGVAMPIEIGPTPPVRDAVLLLDQGDLVAVDPATGKDILRRPHRDRGIHWIGQDGNLVVLAGVAGVEGFDLLHPDVAWWTPAPAEFRHEPLWRLDNGAPKNALSRPAPTHARFEQSWVMIENGHRAAALDPTTGDVVRRAGFDDVAPLTGERLAPFVDGELGNEPRLVARTALDPLGHAAASRNRAALEPGVRLVGEPGGRVSLLNGGRIRWTYQAPWRTSITGAPPQVFGSRDICFAVVPSNQGDELVRLDAATGKPLWSLPPLTFREGLDAAASRVGPDMVYLVVHSEVQARRLTDGSLAWTCPLPARPERWSLELFQGDLIASPKTVAGVPLLSGPTDPFTATLTLALGRRGLGSAPIALIDRDSGKMLSQMDVPYDRGPFVVTINGPRLIVSAGGVVRAFGGAFGGD